MTTSVLTPTPVIRTPYGPVNPASLPNGRELLAEKRKPVRRCGLPECNAVATRTRTIESRRVWVCEDHGATRSAGPMCGVCHRPGGMIKARITQTVPSFAPVNVLGAVNVDVVPAGEAPIMKSRNVRVLMCSDCHADHVEIVKANRAARQAYIPDADRVAREQGESVLSATIRTAMIRAAELAAWRLIGEAVAWAQAADNATATAILNGMKDDDVWSHATDATVRECVGRVMNGGMPNDDDLIGHATDLIRAGVRFVDHSGRTTRRGGGTVRVTDSGWVPLRDVLRVRIGSARTELAAIARHERTVSLDRVADDGSVVVAGANGSLVSAVPRRTEGNLGCAFIPGADSTLSDDRLTVDDTGAWVAVRVHGVLPSPTRGLSARVLRSLSTDDRDALARLLMTGLRSDGRTAAGRAVHAAVRRYAEAV